MWILKIIESFNYAIAGLIHAVRTQKNMQIHLAASIFVLFFSLIFNLSRIELGLVIVAISLVIFAELINTAVEVIIDILTQDYNFKARIAKNISAASVVIAAGNAIFTAYLVFFDKIKNLSLNLIFDIRHEPLHLIFINFFLLFILVITIKSIFASGTPLKGGVVSGHAALAASSVLIIWFLTKSLIALTLGMVLAFLTAQSRLEAGTHSFKEIIMGILLGTIITFIIFYLFRIY